VGCTASSMDRGGNNEPLMANELLQDNVEVRPLKNRRDL